MHNTTTLADAGYGGGADLQAAAQQQKDVLVPPSEGRGQEHPYASKYFHYDALAGTVTCPRGEQLTYQGQTMKRERWCSATAAIAATVRCAPNARPIPKAGRSRFGRTPRRCKR